jgi:signal transduction histidine kinase
VCILAITGGVIAAGIKLLEGVPFYAGFVMLGSLSLAGAGYVVCIKRKMNKLSIAVCYFFGCMVCIPYTFLVGGGVSSGLNAYFVLALVLTFYMFQGRAWIVPVALEILVFLGCIAVSYYSPQTIIGFRSQAVLHVDNVQGVLICGLTIGGLVKFQIWAYQRQKDKADAATRARADFLATMSHEIRTPMNAIIGLQDAILREDLSQTQQKHMHNLKVSSVALLDIVNNILDFSKIEAGGITINDDDLDLYTLLDNLSAVITMSAEQKGLEFRSRLSPGLPRFIRGDETKIRQILNNLLTNAIKYTPQLLFL